MGRLQATVRSQFSMPFSLPRPLPMPRRPRCTSVVLVCALLLGYFIWFDSYTHTRPPLSLIPSPPTEIPPSSSPNTPLPPPPPPPTSPTARVLLVSALFPLQQSKHSMEDYRTWLTHFLGPTGVHSDVYFYTTPALAPLLLSLHTQAQHTHTQRLTINTTYTTPWDVPPITPHREKYARMHAWDRERGRHSAELYAVWNAKPWLLEQALAVSSQHTRGGEGYDYAFWTDAGSFREEHAYRAWPDPARVEEVFRAGKEGGGNLKEDPVFFPLFTVPGRKEYGWRVERGPVDMDFSEGEFALVFFCFFWRVLSLLPTFVCGPAAVFERWISQSIPGGGSPIPFCPGAYHQKRTPRLLDRLLEPPPPSPHIRPTSSTSLSLR
ncbi:hypothetical protein FPV67DRAFT_508666 [Lyophyllum atratum]|nr:hypothetical protein FPV67DRAFT_508666 [Lyophyllum atratum]